MFLHFVGAACFPILRVVLRFLLLLWSGLLFKWCRSPPFLLGAFVPSPLGCRCSLPSDKFGGSSYVSQLSVHSFSIESQLEPSPSRSQHNKKIITDNTLDKSERFVGCWQVVVAGWLLLQFLTRVVSMCSRMGGNQLAIRLHFHDSRTSRIRLVAIHSVERTRHRHGSICPSTTQKHPWPISLSRAQTHV